MLDRQHRLQVESFKKDPCLLEGEELIEFIRWNMLALEDELHEALQEVNWKPWSTAPREIRDVRAYLKELVDAFHFFMNLLLAASPSSADAADEFSTLYFEKADRNAQRQEEGYTGLDKCAKCHRDRTEAGVERMLVGHTTSNHPIYRICCSACSHPVSLDAEGKEICTVCGERREVVGTYTSTYDETASDGTVVVMTRTHCGGCHAPVVRSEA